MVLGITVYAFAIDKIVIRKFGGLNTRTNAYELQEFESQDMSNFVLDTAGSITERNLFKRYNTSSIGTISVPFVYKFYKSSDTGYLICTSGSNLYKASGNVLTDISVSTNSVTAGSQWAFETFTDGTNEMVFGANNSIPMKFWNGTDSTFTEPADYPATNCNILKKHKARLFASGSTTYPYRLYYSSLNNGDDWTTTGGSFDLQTYEKIMALESMGDALYIFTRTAIYVLIGDTPNEFYIIKTPSRVGTHAFKSVALGGNLLYFLNKAGVFVFDGSEATNISEAIQPTVDLISNTYIGSSAGLYDKRGRYWLSYTSANGSFNDTIIVYDTVIKQWYKLEGINLSSFFKADGGQDKGEIFAGSSNPVGFLWQLQTSSALEQISHNTQAQLQSGVTFNTVISSEPKVYLKSIADENGSDELLIHFDGSDASTSYTTEDSSARTVTFTGNAQLDMAQYKFANKNGSSSLLLDGIGDEVSVPDSTDWFFSTGDFTIDFWIRFNAFPSSGDSMMIVGQTEGGGDHWFVSLTNDSGTYKWKFQVQAGGQSTISTQQSDSISTGIWYHVALIRTGNTFRFFRDGSQVGSDATDSDAINNLPVALLIGSSNGGSYFNGWLDEIRINKGTAIWISAFTPYSVEYPYGISNGTLTSANLLINAAGQSSLGTITWQETLPANTDIQFTTRTGTTDDTVDYTGWQTWVSTSTVTEVTDTSAWLSSDSTNFQPINPASPQSRYVLYYETDDNSSPNTVRFDTSGAVSTGDYATTTIASTDLSSYKFVGFWLKSPTTGDSVRLEMGETSSNEKYVTANTVDIDTWEYHYWSLTNYTSSEINGIKNLRLTYLGDGSGQIYLGDITAYDFYDSGDTITSTPNDYIQYRAILGTTDTTQSPQLISANSYVVTLSYSSSGGTSEDSLTSYWKSKVFDNGNLYNKLWQFIEFDLESQNPITNHTVGCDYWLDDVQKTQLSASVAVTGNTTKVRFYLPSGSYGKSFQFQFYDNDVDDDLKINSATISFVQEGGS